MKEVLKLIGSVELLVAIVVVARTMLVPSKQIGRLPHTPGRLDSQKLASDLAGTIPFQNISYEGGGTEEQRRQSQAVFIRMDLYLRETFPLVFQKLEAEFVPMHPQESNFDLTLSSNLLLTWPGSDTSLKPVLLMGHQDVVPIEGGTEGTWTHPPFSGQIADGFIGGRGTMDDKFTIVGVLEAIDALLHEGFRPKRTVYLAFGQDEEIGGLQGAEKIAQLLK
jgi:carboxypeptidase PM20D1